MVQNQSVLGFESGVCRVVIFLPFRGFPRAVLQRRDGPPAAVGGSNIIGSRHDSERASGRGRGASGASPASHGLLPAHHSRGSPSPSPARPGPGGQRGVTAGAAGAGGGLVAGLPRKRAGIASGEDSAAEAAPAASPAIRASSNPCGSLRTFFSRD